MPTTEATLRRNVATLEATTLLDDSAMPTTDAAIHRIVTAPSMRASLHRGTMAAAHSPHLRNFGASRVVARLLLGAVPLADPALHSDVGAS